MGGLAGGCLGLGHPKSVFLFFLAFRMGDNFWLTVSASSRHNTREAKEEKNRKRAQIFLIRLFFSFSPPPKLPRFCR